MLFLRCLLVSDGIVCFCGSSVQPSLGPGTWVWNGLGRAGLRNLMTKAFTDCFLQMGIESKAFGSPGDGVKMEDVAAKEAEAEAEAKAMAEAIEKAVVAENCRRYRVTGPPQALGLGLSPVPRLGG